MSGVVIIALMLLTMSDVSARYFFDNPFAGTVEFAELMLIAIVALAIAGTQRVDGHVGVDFLLNKFKVMKRPVFPVLLTSTLVASEVVFIIALFLLSRAFVESININETTKGPVFAFVWPFKGILVLGLFLMCIRLPIQIIQAVRSIKVWGKVK